MKLFLLLACLFSFTARAEMRGDPSMLGGELPTAPSVDYRFTWWSANLSQKTNDLTVLVPLPREAEAKNAWAFRVFAQNNQIAGGGTLNGHALPAQLWSLGVGGSYHHTFGDREKLGFDVSSGSSSDVPFHSIQEAFLQFNAFYTMPRGERDRWLFFLNYSNVRPFLNHIPLPGVAYAHNPSDTLRALIGLPFLSVFWKFAEKWSVISVLSPFFASAQVAYSIVGPIAAYLSTNWTTQVFLLADRADAEDRFFHAYKTANLGIRAPLSRSLFLDLFVGYAFDRSYSEGKSSVGDFGVPVYTESGLLLSAQARVSF